MRNEHRAPGCERPVALLDPVHRNHEDAHRWFGRNRRHGWATCPITINGCIRVLSSPAYPVDTTAAEVIRRLTVLCSANDHHFWADTVSLSIKCYSRQRPSQDIGR